MRSKTAKIALFVIGLLFIVAGCQHQESTVDPVDITKIAAAGIETALQKDGIAILWDQAIIAQGDEETIGVKIPTTNDKVGIFAALQEDRIIAMYVVDKLSDDRALILNGIQGRLDQVVGMGENPTVVPLEARSLNVYGLENTAEYVLGIKDPFSLNIDEILGIDRGIATSVGPLSSCGPSDAPMYQSMVDAANDYEAASDAYDWAVRLAEAAAATAWYACATCPETVVTCTACVTAVGAAATAAAHARHLGIRKKKAAERVRNLARQVSSWVRSHCQ